MRCIRFSSGIVHCLKILCNCPSSPPTTLSQLSTTPSNLTALFTSLHIWTLCRVILRPRNFCHPGCSALVAAEDFSCVGAKLGPNHPTSPNQAQPIFLCIALDLVSVYGQCSLSLVLGPSWGPTPNLSHPDTTSHCSGAQQPPAPI